MADYCMNCMCPVQKGGTCPHCGFQPEHFRPAPHLLRPGTVLNRRYLIGNSLGQGGFGVTYIGMDQTLHMRVAVKEYFPNGYANRNTEASDLVAAGGQRGREMMEEGKTKFLREAQILARFCGMPGIVDVLNFFEANQTAYIVMEYLDGQDLRRYLRDHSMSANEVFKQFLPLLEILEKIHSENVVHRDISPDNIMRLPDGTLKLMDFGAARVIDYTSPKSISVMLKAGYAPLEQYRSKGILGPWTDIYGLCATMYKCITGLTLDDAPERNEVDHTRWPSELGIPITLLQEKTLQKGLAIRREERFQTAGEMIRMLEGTQTRQEIVIETDNLTVCYPHVFIQGSQGNTQPNDKPSGQRKGSSNENTVKKRHFFKYFAAVTLAVSVCLAARLVLYLTHYEIETGGRVEASYHYRENLNALLLQAKEKGMNPDKSLHVTLTGDRNLTISEISEARETIEGRLDILTDGKPYAILEEGEYIDLLLPEEAFVPEETLQWTLDMLIGNRFVLRIADTQENGLWKTIPVEQNDFESVTLRHEITEDVDLSEYVSDSDKYSYLEIVLKDSFAESIRPESALWSGEPMILISSNSGGIGYSLLFSENGKTWYVLFDEEDTYLELWEYNFSHNKLGCYFNCSIDIDYRTQWEDVSSIQSAGKNQCNFDDFTAGTVSFTLKASQYELEGIDRNSTIAILKSRLDALETPYAFGYVPDHTSHDFIIAIKTTLDHMGYSIMDLIGRDDYNWPRITVGLSEQTLDNPIDYNLSYAADNNGMKLQFRSQEQSDALREMSRISLEEGNGNIFLKTDSAAYFSADIDHIIQDGTVIFTKFLLSENEEWTDGTLWVLRFFDQLWNGVKPAASFYKGDCQIYPSPNGDMPSEADFGIFNPEEQSVREAIRKINPDVEVSVSGLWIFVDGDLYVDETLPEQAVACVKEICYGYDLKNSIFEGISFSLAVKDAVSRENLDVCSMTLRKYFSTSGAEDGYLCLSGSLSGERLKRYQPRMKEIVETDPFFINLTHPEVSEWRWNDY